MIKIKVSYENKEQIEKVIELLHKHIHSFKISRNEKGQYKIYEYPNQIMSIEPIGHKRRL